MALEDPLKEEDLAKARLRAIASSQSQIPSLEDKVFLHRDELRPFRLGIDYLKPEMALKEDNIDSTIVVFGSTRIDDPVVARSRVDSLRAAAGRNPQDSALQKRLLIAERILANSKYYEVARELGRIVSTTCQIGGRCEFVVMTGGGPGLMEAANRGAHDVGAKSVGLNITLPLEQFPNSYITPSLSFNLNYFAIRKMQLVKRARALVAFPGGYGTFDELFEVLCLVQTKRIDPVPVVLVGKEFWSRAFDVQFLVEEGVIDEVDASLFAVFETAEEVWAYIVDWWQRKGVNVVTK
jgi:uncharacterized protein (TIGR00730 family)